MATTTTNFGWDIPQSTDLVKDGATAIATLGQDIDTAFVDLKGGTTGQVLSKASGTDLDFTWIEQDDSTLSFNAQTGTTYTLVASDSGKLVTTSNASAVTVTIPPSVFTTCSHKIFRIICPTLSHRDDVINSIGIHATPIAFSSVSIEDPKS